MCHVYVSSLNRSRTAKAGGDRLSAEECVQLVTNLLAGGIDTTAGQLAHAILNLALGQQHVVWTQVRHRVRMIA